MRLLTCVDVADTITITDNRTGESIEVPIADGGVDALELAQAAARAPGSTTPPS